MNQMEKKSVRPWLVLAVLLAAYHAIVFLVPFDKTPVFWISYAFTLVSFAVAALSIFLAFRKPDARSRFYGFPIARVGVIYFLVQLALGIIFMALGRWVPSWLAALLCVLALAAAAIGMVGTDVVADEIHAQDARLKKEVAAMRSLQSRIGQLAAQCDGAETAGAVKALADELRYSDPVSSEGTAETEAELSALTDELQQAVADGDAESTVKLCNRISGVLAERNRICKLGK